MTRRLLGMGLCAMVVLSLYVPMLEWKMCLLVRRMLEIQRMYLLERLMRLRLRK